MIFTIYRLNNRIGNFLKRNSVNFEKRPYCTNAQIRTFETSSLFGRKTIFSLLSQFFDFVMISTLDSDGLTSLTC